jgi:hypothetical protein
MTDVKQQIKKGYDLRSSVAHGSEPEAKDMKMKGQQVSFEKFVLATEEIVRSGLRKAVQASPDAHGRVSIPWDNLVPPK